MGTFSWVIIVIVLIQVIAGAVAKAAEKRKAQEKAKSLRSETRKQPSPTIRADSPPTIRADSPPPPASPIRGRKKLDLETLRKQRIEALRSRSAAVSAQPPTVPTPVSELPAFVSAEQAGPSQPSPVKKAKISEPPPRQKPQRTPAAKRPQKKVSAQKSKGTSSFGDSLLDSEKGFKSKIFSETIQSTQIGTELGRQEIKSANSKALDEILAEPERIRHGLLLAELLQPPVSMRPQGCGGLD